MSSERPIVLFFSTPEFRTWGDPIPEQVLSAGGVDYQITSDQSRVRDAAAIVFHVPTLSGLREVEKRRGQKWVAWSMESDVNLPQLKMPAFLRYFDLTMTYRLDSDVPILYVTECFGADPREALASAPQPKTEASPVAYFDSNKWASNKRSVYVAELMKHVKVDSYGRTLRNKTLPEDKGRATKLETIARHKFTLAIENSSTKDYVTEKFYDPLVAGSVPVYLGAPNIEDFVPADDCFIKISDFAGPRELAEYLTMLDRDDEQYNRYFAWKQKPLEQSFLDLVAAHGSDPKLRLCAKLGSTGAAAPKAGLLRRWLRT